MEIKDQIRSFLATNFYVPEPAALDDDASLLDQGLIDSTGVLEVIEYLEATFEVKVEDAEILPENLDSVERIVAFVQRKKFES
jgi:acyl carrier protein